MVTVAVAFAPSPEPKPRKVVRLKLIGGGAVELDEAVPTTRADCPTVRPCGHVRCRWHLWRVEADQRPGRPWPEYSPGPELRPAWMQWPLPPSCALDEIREHLARPIVDVARASGGAETQTRLALRRALGKLRDALVARFGDDASAMMRALIGGDA